MAFDVADVSTCDLSEVSINKCGLEADPHSCI